MESFEGVTTTNMNIVSTDKANQNLNPKSPKTILVTNEKSKNLKKKKKISFAMDQHQQAETKSTKESVEKTTTVLKNKSISSHSADEFTSDSSKIDELLSMIPEPNEITTMKNELIFMPEIVGLKKPKLLKTAVKNASPTPRKKTTSNKVSPKPKKSDSISILKSIKSSPKSSSTNISDRRQELISKFNFIPGYGLSTVSKNLGAKKSPYQRLVYHPCIFPRHSKSYETGPIPLALMFPNLTQHMKESNDRTNSCNFEAKGTSKKATDSPSTTVMPNLKEPSATTPKKSRSPSLKTKGLPAEGKVAELVEEVISFKKELANMSDKKSLMTSMQSFLTRQEENLTKLNTEKQPVKTKNSVTKKAKTTKNPNLDENLNEQQKKQKKTLKKKVIKQNKTLEVVPEVPEKQLKNYSRTLMTQDYDKYISFSIPEDTCSLSLGSSESTLVEEQRLEVVFQDFLSSFAEQQQHISQASSRSSICSKVSQLAESTLSEELTTKTDFKFPMLEAENSSDQLALQEVPKNVDVEVWVNSIETTASPFILEKADKQELILARPSSPEDAVSLLRFEPLLGAIRNISIAKPLYNGSSYDRFQVIANFSTPLFRCDDRKTMRCLHVSKSLQNIDLNFLKSAVGSLSTEKVNVEEVKESLQKVEEVKASPEKPEELKESPQKVEEVKASPKKAVQIIPFPRIFPNQLVVKENESIEPNLFALASKVFTKTSETSVTSPPSTINSTEPEVQTKLYNFAQNLLTHVDSAITGAMSHYYDDFVDNCLGEYVLSKPNLPSGLPPTEAKGSNSDDENYEGPEPKFTVLFEKPIPKSLIPVLKKSKRSRNRIYANSNRVRFAPSTKNAVSEVNNNVDTFDSGTETETDVESVMTLDYDSSASEISDISKYVRRDDELLPKSPGLKKTAESQSLEQAQHPTNPFLTLPIQNTEVAPDNLDGSPRATDYEDEDTEFAKSRPNHPFSNAFRNPLQGESLRLTRQEIDELLADMEVEQHPPKPAESDQIMEPQPKSEDKDNYFFDSKIEIQSNSGGTIVEEQDLD